jgi:hypothetical protein
MNPYGEKQKRKDNLFLQEKFLELGALSCRLLKHRPGE